MLLVGASGNIMAMYSHDVAMNLSIACLCQGKLHFNPHTFGLGEIDGQFNKPCKLEA